MLRRRRKGRRDPLGHVDPEAVPARFAGAVRDALDARRRWSELVARTVAGPLHDRLAELGAHVEAGVAGVWDTVQRAAEIERVAATLDIDRVTEDYKRAKRDPSTDPSLLEALQARFTSVQRMLNAVDDADERLRLLDARLGAAVARGAEAVLVSGDAESVAPELEGVVTELGALRDSLLELRTES